MIGSTMGVIAFATENYEPERETTRSYRISIPATINNTTNTTYMNVIVDGVYSESDGYAWVTVRSISFSGSWADRFFYVGPEYSEDGSTAVIDVFYQNGVPTPHSYNLTIELSSTGNWHVEGYSYMNGSISGPIIIDG